LRLALAAGDLFDITSKSEYVETLICKRCLLPVFVCPSVELVLYFFSLLHTAKCIDKYVELRTQSEPAEIDPRMEEVMERMFQRCYTDGCYNHAIGIALDSRRLDKVQTMGNITKPVRSFCYMSG
jgi:26S proteasome regulatory subunit N2